MFDLILLLISFLGMLVPLTVGQGTELYGSLSGNNIPLHLQSNFLLKMAKLAPFSRFLEFVPKRGKPESEKVEWAADDYLPYQLTVTTAVGDTSTTTIEVGASHQDDVVVGDILQNPTTREIMLVNGTSGADSITVKRSIGTSEGTIADNQILQIISNTHYEGGGHPTSKYSDPTWDYNYLQHMIKTWDLSGRYDRIGNEVYKGKGAVYKARRAMRMQEFLREMELTFWFGQRAIDTSTIDSVSQRRTMMGGVEEYLRTATDRTYNMNTTSLTWAIIEAMAEQAFVNTDSDTLWAFASGLFMSQCNQLLYNKWTPNSRDEKKLGTRVMELETSWGIIKLIREYWFKGEDLEGYVFFVDKKCFEKCETIPLKVTEDTQDKETDARHGRVEWEGSLVVHHPDRMLLGYGLSD